MILRSDAARPTARSWSSLVTNRPIDLLPDRTGDALAAWLRAHPGVKLICRDRSSEYARGASEGAPEAQQIVDRWHVLKNVGEVVLRVVGRMHAALKQRQAASGVQVHVRYKKQREPQRARCFTSLPIASPSELQGGGDALPTREEHGRSRRAAAPEPNDSAQICLCRSFSRTSDSRAARKGQLGSSLPYLEQRVQEGCDNASLRRAGNSRARVHQRLQSRQYLAARIPSETRPALL